MKNGQRRTCSRKRRSTDREKRRCERRESQFLAEQIAQQRLDESEQWKLEAWNLFWERAPGNWRPENRAHWSNASIPIRARRNRVICSSRSRASATTDTTFCGMWFRRTLPQLWSKQTEFQPACQSAP